MSKWIAVIPIALVFLSSCTDNSAACECYLQRADNLKKYRESGYTTKTAYDLEPCAEMSRNLEGLSGTELQEKLKEFESCPAYKEMEREDNLWEQHMMKEVQRELDEEKELH